MLRKLSVGLACLAVLATGAACTATPSGGGSGPLPVSYNILAAAPYVLQPTKPPAGSNNNSCKPTAAHPYPVVLVNGTIATMGENWPVLSPLLKNNGYCVFAFNYGGTWLSSLLLGNIQGLDSAAGSANELKSYVNFVLGQTGATKVDLVGHSQGGMLPNYYVKFLGGAPKVHSIIGLAPDNHGTTLSGLVTLGNKFSQFFPPLMPFINIMLGLAAPSFVDQQIGSPFIQQLNSLPDTVPGINYTVIATKYDEVVTPYTSSFLDGPNVKNITLQDQCDLDYSEHISIAFNHIALGEVLNALDPAHAVTPVCSPVYPAVGG
jgi:triacylglycerol esterase/lipase EstA (alpha/beta hydrolase family)